MSSIDLAVALHHRDVDAVQEQMRRNVNVNDISPLNFKPMVFHLTEAIVSPEEKWKLIQVLQVLASSPNFFIDITANDGKMPIHSAARFRSPEFIREMVSLGADIEGETPDGNTPIMETIDSNNSGMIHRLQMLILLGADVTHMNHEFQTPLLLAVRLQRPVAVLEALLNAGANVNTTSEVGMTPLMEAAKNNDKETVNFLLRRGADKTKEWMMNEKVVDFATDPTVKKLLN